MQSGWTRRDLTAGLLSLVGSQALVGCGTPNLPPLPRAGEVVDAHCHTFNGKDLPIVRFLTKVVIPENERDQASRALRRRIEEPTVGEVVLELIVRGLLSNTPTAAQEADILERGQRFAPQDDQKRARDRVIETTAQVVRNAPPEDARIAAQMADPGRTMRVRSAILRAIGEDTAALRERPLSEDDSRAIAARAFSSESFGPVLSWAALFTRFRHTLVAELAGNLRRDGREPVLLTPLMIDFSRWLGEDPEESSSLSQQVRVFTAISKTSGAPAVHGMVAFDPLRAVYFKRGARSGNGLEPLDPLKIVEDALSRGGFLGVKLYPPMGFRPIGNTDEQGYPEHVSRHFKGTRDLGKDLDEQLARLYDLCSALDVPIIAHAAYSQGAGPEYARRADPYYWTQVLSQPRWRRLRVCLAHQGRFATRSVGGTRRRDSLEGTYEWVIGQHIGRNPDSHLFMDVSYLSDALTSDRERKREQALPFRRWIDAFDPGVDRIVFGTDWVMVGIEAGSAGYTRQIIDFLRTDVDLTDEQVARVMHHNAGRYLGLRQNNPSRSRLENFYVQNGISPNRLPNFT